MSRNIRYIFVILTAVFVTFIILISRFYLKVDTAIKKDGYEIDQSGIQNNMLTVFSDDNGLKGMKNSNNVIVIEAKWESIRQIAGNKFIVSLKDNKNIKYGVVDIMETVIIPVIYADIQYIDMDGYFVGKTENDSFVLMDTDGSAIIEKEWDKYFKKDTSSDLSSSGNHIQLESNEDVYRIRCIDNIMSLYYIKLNRRICGYKRQIEIRNNINNSINLKKIPGYYNEVIDTAITYVNNVFSNDVTQIKKMSFDDSYKKIQLDELGIRGAELRYVDTIWPFVEDENGTIRFSCNVSLMYSVPGTIQWDGSYINNYNTAVFRIRMERDQDGILKISDVITEDVDISKLDIPEECFDKDDQDDGDSSSIENSSSDDSQKQDVITG